MADQVSAAQLQLLSTIWSNVLTWHIGRRQTQYQVSWTCLRSRMYKSVHISWECSGHICLFVSNVCIVIHTPLLSYIYIYNYWGLVLTCLARQPIGRIHMNQSKQLDLGASTLSTVQTGGELKWNGVCAHTYLNTYIPTNAHTYIHINRQAQTHTQKCTLHHIKIHKVPAAKQPESENQFDW